MYLGIDCGTQSTKVVVLEVESGELLGEASAPHTLLEGPNGRREQQPSDWIKAMEAAVPQALGRSGVDGQAVRGIGVSGQQHGMVALDAEGAPVYPAKLWNDTESWRENQALIDKLGGKAGSLETLGLVLQTGYTASKLAWLRKNHPEAYQSIDSILLPHDYLNFWLTGEQVTEAGDASGTGYFDTRNRCWQRDVFNHVAPELNPDRVLPRLIDARSPVGRIRPEAARRLGLSSRVLVSSGGGDNMMGAIGTGNISPGLLTMSLGTSGTLCAYSDRPVSIENDLAAHFCDSTGGWLPLICTMNVTSATNLVRQLFGLDINAYNACVESAAIGAGGVVVLPFFNGERVPALPNANASFHGLTSTNTNAENLCRAVMESTVFGLKFGLEQLGSLADQAREVRLIGGGARSEVWRRMVADTLNATVICPKVTDAAALGAALQAAWCDQSGNQSLVDLCDRAVELDEKTRIEPSSAGVDATATVYESYRQLLRFQYDII